METFYPHLFEGKKAQFKKLIQIRYKGQKLFYGQSPLGVFPFFRLAAN